MICSTCGYSWDVNDADRPKCLTEKERNQRANKQSLREIYKALGFGKGEKVYVD